MSADDALQITMPRYTVNVPLKIVSNEAITTCLVRPTQASSNAESACGHFKTRSNANGLEAGSRADFGSEDNANMKNRGQFDRKSILAQDFHARSTISSSLRGKFFLR
jgi:hypothetical protein